MKKLEKCVNFILILPVFFATNCTYLLTENYLVEI
jgi:hypothetical protein